MTAQSNTSDLFARSEAECSLPNKRDRTIISIGRATILGSGAVTSALSLCETRFAYSSSLWLGTALSATLEPRLSVDQTDRMH